MPTEATFDAADDGVVDFSEYFRALVRRKWLILALALLGALGGYAFGMTAAKSYTATAVVQVRTVAADDKNPDPGGNINISTQQQVASAGAVAEVVQKRLKTTQTTGQLLSGLIVTVPGKANTLTISYTAGNPKDAATLAQAFAESYLQYRRDPATKLISDRTKAAQAKLVALQGQITKVQGVLATQPKGSTAYNNAAGLQNVLQQQVAPLQQNLNTLEALIIDPGQVIADAVPPTKPSGLSSKILIVAGLLVGLVLGLILALVRDRTDKRLQRRGSLTRQLGMPVLAVLPGRAGSLERREDTLVTLTNNPPYAVESYEALVAGILVTGRRENLRTLAVTGPLAGKSAAMVAANVAVSITRSGQRTVLVSAAADGTLERMFDLGGEPGLHDVIAGDASLGAALHHHPTVERLTILPSGTADGSGRLINPETVRRLLASLREDFDFVVIAAPPALVSAEALVLGSAADAVVIVAQAGSTRTDDVADVTERLESLGAHVLGAVVSGGRVPPARRRAQSRPVAVASSSAVETRSNASVLQR